MRAVVRELLDNALVNTGGEPFMEEYGFRTFEAIAWDVVPFGIECSDAYVDPDLILPHVIEWCKEHNIHEVD